MNNISIRCLMQLGLPIKDSVVIARELKPFTCRSDEIFSERGQPLPGWIYILSGCFVGSVSLAGTGDYPLGVYGKNEWMGEDILLSQRRSAISIAAATDDVHCLVLPRAAFKAAFDHIPTFATAVTKILSERSSRQTEEIVAMRIQSLPLRALVLLALEVESHALGCMDYYKKLIPKQLVIPISQDLLARICGVSRTVMSGFLKSLRNNGLVQVNYGSLNVLRVISWLQFLRHYRKQPSLGSPDSMDELLNSLSQVIGVVKEEVSYEYKTTNFDCP